MTMLKWFALFVFIFFCSMWVARQTGQNLDNPWTTVGAALVSGAIVAGLWYKYMVDLMASLVNKPEIGLGANRTATGERISTLDREK